MAGGGNTKTIFFTKKQKKLMRERRRKKKVALKQQQQPDVVSKKRPRTEDTSANSNANNSNNEEKEALDSMMASASASAPTSAADTSSSNSASTAAVIIPANLTIKEAKKFRKDARRKARANGQDDTKLKFFIEGEEEKKAREEEEKKPAERPKKKPKKKKNSDIPRINEIVEIAKREQEKKSKLDAIQDEEKLIPEIIKKRYVAIDCEMVGIGPEGRKSALARVSLTDWYDNVILDTFVKVPSRVTDFRTHVSGIKPKHIASTASEAMDVTECRDTVATLIRDKILVGHSLKNDLDALMMQHPRDTIRDTAKYRPLQRYGGQKWRPRKLRDLVKEHLDLDIQQEGQSHDSIDDARATMQLYKFFRKQWEEELQAKAERKKK